MITFPFPYPLVQSSVNRERAASSHRDTMVEVTTVKNVVRDHESDPF